MSASLVGSEMCIRDSENTETANLLHEVKARTARSRTRPQRTQKVSSGAVSYTHLTLPTICSV
eukprot:9656071-Alexandrium_andersonii.AAC.1